MIAAFINAFSSALGFGAGIIVTCLVVAFIIGLGNLNGR